MSFVERTSVEMSDAFAEKLAEEFSDILDDICCTLTCDCDDEDHGIVVLTWREYIDWLRDFDGDFAAADPSFVRAFLEMVAPVAQYAYEMDQDPLDVVREHTFRLDE